MNKRRVCNSSTMLKTDTAISRQMGGLCFDMVRRCETTGVLVAGGEGVINTSSVGGVKNILSSFSFFPNRRTHFSRIFGHTFPESSDTRQVNSIQFNENLKARDSFEFEHSIR